MRGSKNYPTLAAISKRLNHLYAARIWFDVIKSGETQLLRLSAYMLDNKYSLDGTDIIDETIDIFGDIFLNPLIKDGSFKPEYVENEKTNLTNEILAQINNKNAYVNQKCVETMCKNEKYAINNMGTVESVQSIDGAALFEHYNYILSNLAIEIFCVGNFEDKKEFITDKFKNMLKNIARVPAEKYGTDVILSAEYKGETTEEMEVNQGKLAMGFRIGTSAAAADYMDFGLFSMIFGESPTSKLFENVREKLSLCYYCYPVADPWKGVMVVSSGIEVENKQKAQDEILNQLEEMKKGNFTAKDIEDAKLYVINSFKSFSDSAGGIIGWYMSRLLLGSIVSIEDKIKEVNEATREGIINAANKITLDTVYFLKGVSENNDGEAEEE